MDFKVKCCDVANAAVHVDLPGSKSMTARALLMNAMSEQEARLTGVGVCDDAFVIADALRHRDSGRIDIGASGTAMRFLTAYFASQPGVDVLLTGTERMCHRPIGALVEALRSIGADISWVGEEGFPPLQIRGRELEGGHVAVRGDISSQFISALMMTGNRCRRQLTIHLLEQVASQSYLEMTYRMMRQFGIDVRIDEQSISIPVQSYLPPVDYAIEADWSAASYFYEAVLLSGCEVELSGLRHRDESLQGDSRAVELFARLGVVSQFTVAPSGVEVLRLSRCEPTDDELLDVDMRSCPDLVPALAVSACLSNRCFMFGGTASLRIKETDRVFSLVSELRKLGYFLRCDEDTISWEGERCSAEEFPSIKTYNDHRMAMAFAPAAAVFPHITIRDAGVVTKSFPDFWGEMSRIGFTTEVV